MSSEFKRGDWVEAIDGSDRGIVLGVEGGLPRVRFGTDNWSGLYWPYDLVKVKP